MLDRLFFVRSLPPLSWFDSFRFAWEMFYFSSVSLCRVENVTANVTWCIVIDWYAVRLMKWPSWWNVMASTKRDAKTECSCSLLVPIGAKPEMCARKRTFDKERMKTIKVWKFIYRSLSLAAFVLFVDLTQSSALWLVEEIRILWHVFARKFDYPTNSLAIDWIAYCMN